MNKSCIATEGSLLQLVCFPLFCFPLLKFLQLILYKYLKIHDRIYFGMSLLVLSSPAWHSAANINAVWALQQSNVLCEAFISNELYRFEYKTIWGMF